MTRPINVWLPVVRAGSGTDVFVERLAKGLEKSGHHPIVQWFSHDHEWAAWKFNRAIVPKGVDLVHANSWQGDVFKRLTGLPLVVTEHQYVTHPAFAPYRRPMQRIYHATVIEPRMRRAFRVADAVTTVSEFCAEAMRADLSRGVDVVHHWVDLDQFVPGHRAGDSSGERRFRLLFVGNPTRWKGADLLPAIADMLGDEFEIVCLGGLRFGHDRQAGASNMTYIAPVSSEDMPSIYRSVDAALIPARYEAFGYVALEAMACGLPVVGFNVAGSAEVCVHDQTALLAPLDDIQQLVAHARRLRDDAGLRTRLGKSSRDRAERQFSPQEGIASYLAIYERVLAGR